MNPSTIIRLRRPAIVSLGDREWLPDPHLREEAERRWSDMQASNPKLYDGKMIQVAGVHRNGAGGAVIQGFPCDFRWYAVQSEADETGSSHDCMCRPLGVKGVTFCNGRVLLGRRAPWTTWQAGYWELAPSGGVEPGNSPEEALTNEFAEEIGRVLASTPRAEAVMFDPNTRTWEVVLSVEMPTDDIGFNTGEYEEFAWVNPSEIPENTTPIAERILHLLS
ncbi:MAG: NUDIX domain-containing protein [Planctomycetes bacterium]|nr:NUDIX domain-containing protein [Planctomycetota bacterium]MCP4839616.1 NUDIX domain-containing protein [Planctomycetota bacterium]